MSETSGCEGIKETSGRVVGTVKHFSATIEHIPESVVDRLHDVDGVEPSSRLESQIKM